MQLPQTYNLGLDPSALAKLRKLKPSSLGIGELILRPLSASNTLLAAFGFSLVARTGRTSLDKMVPPELMPAYPFPSCHTDSSAMVVFSPW